MHLLINVENKFYFLFIYRLLTSCCKLLTVHSIDSQYVQSISNWKARERKQSQRQMRPHSSIYMVQLRKTTRTPATTLKFLGLRFERELP